ncbi:hypothetical protein AAFF_G00194820 [Aldrovandia affinis]|uniref:Uncharacterized protein n=1 Tax=Aldrovandia affinis TaxID=143900 RepID=A0AAD7WVK8_9TELE|nr:hypothetical protein AAFF_G00194820 [Aldrovandia affinis]
MGAASANNKPQLLSPATAEHNGLPAVESVAERAVARPCSLTSVEWLGDTGPHTAILALVITGRLSSLAEGPAGTGKVKGRGVNQAPCSSVPEGQVTRAVPLSPSSYINAYRRRTALHTDGAEISSRERAPRRPASAAVDASGTMGADDASLSPSLSPGAGRHRLSEMPAGL